MFISWSSKKIVISKNPTGFFLWISKPLSDVAHEVRTQAGYWLMMLLFNVFSFSLCLCLPQDKSKCMYAPMCPFFLFFFTLQYIKNQHRHLSQMWHVAQIRANNMIMCLPHHYRPLTLKSIRVDEGRNTVQRCDHTEDEKLLQHIHKHMQISLAFFHQIKNKAIKCWQTNYTGV